MKNLTKLFLVVMIAFTMGLLSSCGIFEKPPVAQPAEPTSEIQPVVEQFTSTAFRVKQINITSSKNFALYEVILQSESDPMFRKTLRIESNFYNPSDTYLRVKKWQLSTGDIITFKKRTFSESPGDDPLLGYIELNTRK